MLPLPQSNTPRHFSKLNEILDKHQRKVHNLVAILQDVQAEYRYLPEEVLTYVATALDLPPAMVFGAATFYAQFSLAPKGKYVIKVCNGTACHVRGAEKVNFAVREAVGLRDGEVTAPDLSFTVETVACLGACGLSPVMMVNDELVFGQMTPEEARRVIEKIREEEAEVAAQPPEVKLSVGPPIKSAAAGTAPAVRINDPAELEAHRARARAAIAAQKVRFLVCLETACVASGADKVFEAFRKALQGRGELAEVVVLEEHRDHPGTPGGKGASAGSKAGLVKAGCHGYCQAGPLVKVEPDGVFYTHVKPEDVPEIVEAALSHERPVQRLLWKDPATGRVCPTEKDIPFYAGQKKVALENCGLLDSEEIAEYIAFGGYGAIARALTKMTPDQVIAEITASGLRGRGGAGFPTGKKWLFAKQAQGPKKYVVCNGDEGDPGAFMDRSVMEGDPHRVIEGMMVAGYAVGADEGYIYCRAEYPLAVKRLRRAIDQARAAGLLGRNILGSGFSFDINLKEGAGAFVCGEETALLASIEGRRGMPRPRPPFPANAGLFGKPTLINNVETYANVPSILNRGGAWFATMGTPKSPGTKTFAVAGQVARTGLIEVPMGIKLREVIFGIAGGMRDPKKKFKAVQIGGPSGGCLTEQHLDLPLDYESLSAAGAMVGSGGLVVMDEDTCMVEVARFFMNFVQEESCGKCVPCREGTKRLLAILTKITGGRGTVEDLDLLQELAAGIKEGALCGLGKTAPNAVLTTLRYFRHEYEAHVRDRICPAGVCSGLKRYRVIAEKCKGCAVCARACPAGAITGEVKKPHTINPDLCTKCGTCQEKCKFGAIEVI